MLLNLFILLILKMCPASIKKQRLRMDSPARVCRRLSAIGKGRWEDKFGGVNRQALLGVFFSFSKHYSAASEVSLFLSVLINKVRKD